MTSADGRATAVSVDERHDRTLTVPWLTEGTRHLLRSVEDVSDAELREPCLLPGWTRAHLIAHVARNAEALGRLAAWARTGVETPMYADPAQRDAEIEISSRYPAARLRDELAETADDLDRAFMALDLRGWDRIVRSAQGRMIPATEVLWLRVREVWLHTVDLDTGASAGDHPERLVDVLLDDLTRVLSGRENCPAVTLVVSDRDRTWSLGPPDVASVQVRATAAQLVEWLAGRRRGDGVRSHSSDPLPPVPRWV
jgi:maleylpyruvate isomerase